MSCVPRGHARLHFLMLSLEVLKEESALGGADVAIDGDEVELQLEHGEIWVVLGLVERSFALLNDCSVRVELHAREGMEIEGFFGSDGVEPVERELVCVTHLGRRENKDVARKRAWCWFRGRLREQEDFHLPDDDPWSLGPGKEVPRSDK